MLQPQLPFAQQIAANGTQGLLRLSHSRGSTLKRPASAVRSRLWPPHSKQLSDYQKVSVLVAGTVWEHRSSDVFLSPSSCSGFFFFPPEEEISHHSKPFLNENTSPPVP